MAARKLTDTEEELLVWEVATTRRPIAEICQDRGVCPKTYYNAKRRVDARKKVLKLKRKQNENERKR
jgi:hypothetical protein